MKVKIYLSPIYDNQYIIDELQKELRQSLDTITELRQQLESLQSQLNELEQSNNQLSSQVNELTGQIGELQNTITEKENRITELEQQLENAGDKEELERLQGKVTQLQSQLSDKDNKIRELESRIEQLEQELEDGDLSNELEQANAEITQLTEQLNEKETTINELNKQLSDVYLPSVLAEYFGTSEFSVSTTNYTSYENRTHTIYLARESMRVVIIELKSTNAARYLTQGTIEVTGNPDIKVNVYKYTIVANTVSWYITLGNDEYTRDDVYINFIVDPAYTSEMFTSYKYTQIIMYPPNKEMYP